MAHLLTVLFPTLNAQEHLIEALDSLAMQSSKTFKVLLLDGGSTDSTIHLAEKYDALELDVIHCGRIGLGGQLKVGLHLADTSFVARMDADDVTLGNRFEKQLEALEKDPELAIVGSQIDLLIGSKICRAAGLPVHHEQIRKLLKSGIPAFCHPSVMFRTDLARRCGAYSILGLGEDLDFFIRMTERGGGRNLPEVLHRYRIHKNSSSFQSFDEVRRNYFYALECANARQAGRPEPSPSAHMSQWCERGFWARIATRLECLGVTLYRRGRIHLAERKYLPGVLSTLLSLLIRPRLVRARLQLVISGWHDAIK